jgi:hypothetical protein
MIPSSTGAGGETARIAEPRGSRTTGPSTRPAACVPRSRYDGDRGFGFIIWH